MMLKLKKDLEELSRYIKKIEKRNRELEKRNRELEKRKNNEEVIEIKDLENEHIINILMKKNNDREDSRKYLIELNSRVLAGLYVEDSEELKIREVIEELLNSKSNEKNAINLNKIKKTIKKYKLEKYKY